MSHKISYSGSKSSQQDRFQYPPDPAGMGNEAFHPADDHKSYRGHDA